MMGFDILLSKALYEGVKTPLAAILILLGVMILAAAVLTARELRRMKNGKDE